MSFPKRLNKQALLGWIVIFGVGGAAALLTSFGQDEAARLLKLAAQDGHVSTGELIEVVRALTPLQAIGAIFSGSLLGGLLLHGADNK